MIRGDTEQKKTYKYIDMGRERESGYKGKTAHKTCPEISSK